jgi:hypothetical protein
MQQVRIHTLQWRFIVDLRHLNSFRVRQRLRMKSLIGVRHLTRKGDYMFSFDDKDGFYALGIVPEQRDFLTVNVRGQLYPQACLPKSRWDGRSALTTSAHLRTHPNDTSNNQTPVVLRHIRGSLHNPTTTDRASASYDTRGGAEQKSYLTTSSSSPPLVRWLWCSVSF